MTEMMVFYMKNKQLREKMNDRQLIARMTRDMWELGIKNPIVQPLGKLAGKDAILAVAVLPGKPCVLADIFCRNDMVKHYAKMDAAVKCIEGANK